MSAQYISTKPQISYIVMFLSVLTFPLVQAEFSISLLSQRCAYAVRLGLGTFG